MAATEAGAEQRMIPGWVVVRQSVIGHWAKRIAGDENEKSETEATCCSETVQSASVAARLQTQKYESVV